MTRRIRPTPTLRRVSMSFNPEQILWQRDLLAALRRGGDVSGLMRGDLADQVAATITLASIRAEAMAAKLKPGRRTPPRTHCTAGHEYTPENTDRDPDGMRVCIECRRGRGRRARERANQQRDELLRQLSEAAE